ncbi:MAG TPA: hypothetical protein VIG99_16970 [Myxococcaceae bacterium]|jgi:hypothetical protein
MPFLLHVGATATCPHGAPVQISPGNPRVKVGGRPVATMSDGYLVTGCPATAGPVPIPCTQVKWLVPSARVRAGGQPVVLDTSTGMCLTVQQAPAGPPTVTSTQVRARGK